MEFQILDLDPLTDFYVHNVRRCPVSVQVAASSPQRMLLLTYSVTEVAKVEVVKITTSPLPKKILH